MQKRCAGRPQNCRWIENIPEVTRFQPASGRKKESITITFDELEAMRLADLEGMYQEQAAQQIRVSRQTFGRIIASAHKKVAEALVNGKIIRIEGGEVSSINPDAALSKPEFCTCPRKLKTDSESCPSQTCPKCGKGMVEKMVRDLHNN